MTLRWNWGAGVAAAYATFALGTLGFVSYAMGQRVDLVSEDYYARAIDHDGRVAALERADALGAAFAAALADDGRTFVVHWPDVAAGSRAAGHVLFYRPSDATADRVVPIQPDTRGHQRIAVGDLAHGLWRVQIGWTTGGRAYFAERVISVGR